MQILTSRLGSIREDRQIQREGRKDVLKVALVGYTNAGKSTLLNAMTHSSVLAENKLFSTLDSSVRALDPNSHPPVVAIDTVGFIDRLPPSLIASFRSTLEELQFADLLLHVVDGSSPRAREQIEVTERVLEELGLQNKPRQVVLNKMDRVKEQGKLNWTRIVAPGSVRVSALKKDDMIRLRDLVLERFRQALGLWEVVIPYSESRLESQIHAHGSIESVKHLEAGTFYRVRIADEWANKLQLARFKP
jgi:GTP-binding protein HflX